MGEQKLMDFESDDERKAYCEETKCTSILDKIVVQGYKALQLQYFFTAGEAEVMKFAAFKEHGSEAAVKAAGGYRQQGKNYIVEDGDIIFFKFNAGAGLTAGKKDGDKKK